MHSDINRFKNQTNGYIKGLSILVVRFLVFLHFSTSLIYLFIPTYKHTYRHTMSADLQSFMGRRGVKAMGLVLLLSCLALLAKYYTYEPNSSHFRRALFYRNDSSIQQGQFNSHFSWTDGNGKSFKLLSIGHAIYT